MTDHSHDLDLIAALAGGLADDEALARRLLDECAVCRDEYELQRQMKELLSSLPTPTMTETERQRLHQAMSAPLGARVITFTERRRAQTWMKVGTIAAGLVVVVGLGSVFLRMRGGAAGGDALFEAAAATTTTVADTFTTTAAASTDLEGFGGSANFLASLPGGDEAAVQAEVEQLLEAARRDRTFEEAADSSQRSEPRCVDRLEGLTIATAAESFLDGRPIVIYVVEDDPSLRAVIFDSATCAEVELG
ncbi:MAG TPA: hypothetical protein VJR05_03050 [Acidimicrobiia bacterium]|nr:hypothetical protein [Acidimicrobiia bacterium]